MENMSRPEHKSYSQKLFTRWFGQCLEDITRKEEALQLCELFLPSATTMPRQSLMVPFIISVHVLMCYIWFVLWHHVTLASLRLTWASSLQELFRFNRLINAHPSIHSLNHVSRRGHRGPEPAGDRIYSGLVYHRANREWNTSILTSLVFGVWAECRQLKGCSQQVKVLCNLCKLPLNQSFYFYFFSD